MSIRMNITVDVPLQAIADVKAGRALGGSSSGYEVYENIVQAITKEAHDFPYDVVDTPEITTEPFEVAVKTLTGKKIYISVTSDESAEMLASKVQDKEGIPPDQQALFYKGKPIFHSKWEGDKKIQAKRTLKSLGIIEPTEIHLILTI